LKFFSDAKNALVEHLVRHALRTDGPFRLASGATSDWYLDGRQTTYDGAGARLVGTCLGFVIDPTATAVGGLTMGADPVAMATAVLSDPPLKAFSVRKETKDHGAGGRLVGPVGPGDRAVVVDDTTTTGASLVAATDALRAAGVEVVQSVVVVDRSGGAAARRMDELGVPFTALVTPEELGVADASPTGSAP
jgi:orotate phosphoribosyltransferase